MLAGEATLGIAGTTDESVFLSAAGCARRRGGAGSHGGRRGRCGLGRREAGEDPTADLSCKTEREIYHRTPQTDRRRSRDHYNNFYEFGIHKRLQRPKNSKIRP